MAYSIELTREALRQLASLDAPSRALVVLALREQLRHEPDVQTRNRKRMRPERPGFVAPWELRAGDLRVYYEVETPEKRVRILAIGLKVRERILFGGKVPGDER